MVDVRNLLEYNETVRHRYFETLAKLSWKELTKNREASFHSIRNIFVHILGVIDYWLDFLQKQDLHSKKDYDKHRTLEEVRAYMKHVEKRTHEYLKLLTNEGLNRTYTVKNDDGRS